MKPICANCSHFKTICELKLSNSYGQCKKYKSIEMSQIIEDRNKLIVSQDNPARLQYLKDYLDYLHYGIVK